MFTSRWFVIGLTSTLLAGGVWASTKGMGLEKLNEKKKISKHFSLRSPVRTSTGGGYNYGK